MKIDSPQTKKLLSLLSLFRPRMYLLLDHTLLLQAEDYIEIMWAPTDAQVTLSAGAAITSPYARPTRPSVVCNVFQIAAA